MRIKKFIVDSFPTNGVIYMGDVLTHNAEASELGEGVDAKIRNAEKLKMAGHIVALVEVRLPKNLRNREDLHGKPYKPSLFVFWKEVIPHDRLQVTLVSRYGVFGKRTMQGAAYLTIAKEFGNGKPCDQIAVEVQHTTGKGPFTSLVEHRSALINIVHDGATIWTGTFSQLAKSLKGLKAIEDEYRSHSEEVNKLEILNIFNSLKEKT